MAKRTKKLVIVKVNGNKITLDFNYKPDAKERNRMKDCHFRWSPSDGIWYGKNTTSSRRMVNSLQYIQDFVPVPKATEEDFNEWQRSLKADDWYTIIHAANDEWLVTGGVMADVLQNELQRRFMSQWA